MAESSAANFTVGQKDWGQRVAKKYGQQKRNIIHTSSTAYEQDHSAAAPPSSVPWLDKDMQPLALTEAEIDDVVAFLAALISPQYKQIGDPKNARQLALSKVSRPQRDTARAFGPKPKQPPPPPF